MAVLVPMRSSTHHGCLVHKRLWPSTFLGRVGDFFWLPPPVYLSVVVAIFPSPFSPPSTLRLAQDLLLLSSLPRYAGVTPVAAEGWQYQHFLATVLRGFLSFLLSCYFPPSLVVAGAYLVHDTLYSPPNSPPQLRLWLPSTVCGGKAGVAS